ncbi:MAG: TolC family protein [Bacteroidetes bacterium]|nr:TolC family protein [Bacteroidota bacterium]
MERKKLILFILLYLVFRGYNIGAQEMITLKECYDRAYTAAVVSAEKEVYNRIWEYKDKNLSRAWLPTLDANGSFTYNSSVMDINDVIGALPVPGIGDMIKPLPNEQYKVTVDINQMIYDGGAIKSARAFERAGLLVNEKQNETDLYKLRSEVNTYYFNILLLERQEDLLQNYLELINKKIIALESAVENGMVPKSDIDVLSSEKLKLEQQISENSIRKTSLIKNLSDLTGYETDTSVQLVVPPINEELTDELFRPELQIFDLRKEQLEESVKQIQSRRIPKAFGFATFGYGNPPGSNFFRDEFAPFYILGAGVKWNILDWNKAKNEKQIVLLQKDLIDGRKKEMKDNLKRMLNAKNAEIKSMKELLETDIELIELRKRITSAAESKYNNGTITATEYLNELNAENQARINYEIHTISLALARVEYMNISGQEIE